MAVLLLLFEIRKGCMAMVIRVKKKDGSLEDFCGEKIVNAVQKSSLRVAIQFTSGENAWLVKNVRELCERKAHETDTEIIVPVSDLHTYVEMSLENLNPRVAKSYENYRNWKGEMAKMWDRVAEKANSLMYLGDRDNENANANGKLVATKRSLIFNEYNKELFLAYNISEQAKEAQKDGFIHIHDMNARRDSMNCCLFDLSAVLSGGFECNGQWYNEPASLDVAGDVIGDVVFIAASQQYGGFTIPEIDKVLVPYAEKTYQKSYQRNYDLLTSLNIDAEIAKQKSDEQAMQDVEKEMRGVFQGFEYKFNTVGSSRGDYPFITFSFGLGTSKFAKMAAQICLETRMNGQGRKGAKKPVLFPKLVFLYDEELHGEGKPLEDVFELAIKSSQKCMYPDYLSLTGMANGEEVYGSVPYMYRHFKTPVSPMGCRAFLSPWYEHGGMYPADEADRPVYVGRFNIGAVSLNLPMIFRKSQMECTDFFDTLDVYLQVIRQIHLDTYEYLGKMKASCNPLAYCEGGFYGGHLAPDENIEPVLDSATASFGVTALNELQRLYNGKSLVEDSAFAMSVMEHIIEKVNAFKTEDGRLYAIYGTPAENLSGTQVRKFRAKYGIIKNVSEREYFSNSFHCHVTENITPTQKQDIEEKFWDKFLGGRIQYVRCSSGDNFKAIKTLVRRAMQKGYYFGVNISLSYCEECGHSESNMDVCPVCGSKNLTKIDRVCGYLGFSRQPNSSTENARKNFEEISIEDRIATANKHVEGERRTSAHKSAEIAERVSM